MATLSNMGAGCDDATSTDDSFLSPRALYFASFAWSCILCSNVKAQGDQIPVFLTVHTRAAFVAARASAACPYRSKLSSPSGGVESED